MVRKKTKILLATLAGLIIIGGLLTLFYRLYSEGRLQRYVSTIATCENIQSEDECFAREKCEGIYAAASPPQFKECRRVPEKFLAQYSSQEQLCTSTGGKWMKTKYGRVCSCDEIGQARTFDESKGCVGR